MLCVSQKKQTEHGYMIETIKNEQDMDIAPNTIEIDGITYNKCHISEKQWDDCITPCTFCHSNVQKHCKSTDTFCRGNEEQICYVCLGDIYGEEE